MIVAHPSLAAESFCFAFFECLLFSDTAIPVVGCFGNPAALIRETGAGVVMAEMSARGLVSACERAREEYSRFAAKRAQYREKLRGAARDYPEEYLKLVEAQGLKIQLRSPMLPVMKLAFHGMCDDPTIARLEAVLAWALEQELPRGSLAERIEAAGGLARVLEAPAP